ncbi:MAG: twin-arginine translocation signal domain-containing protein [Planctomycetaceae bacterium]|nr:twin-arginine translocation signal domain-containing protein [Planctomycetaceae bacterium]
MKRKRETITRREFVKYSAMMSTAAAGLAGVTVFTDALAQNAEQAPEFDDGNDTSTYLYSNGVV